MWALDERRGTLRRRIADPILLASGPISWQGAVPSADGQTIFSQGQIFRGELIRYNLETKQVEPYLNGKSFEMLSFSRDRKYLIYTSFPDGILWRANTDGSGVQQVGRAVYSYPANCRLSPDGSQIVFTDIDVAEWHSEIYLVAAKGGTPVRLAPNETGWVRDPTWSPEGDRIAFEGDGIHILNLRTEEITSLPRAPLPAVWPRWSPKGRYLACTNLDGERQESTLEIFDFKTQSWKVLPIHRPLIDWPSWSWDSRLIYWSEWHEDGVALYRIRVDGGEPELVVDFPGFHTTGWVHGWMGLDPDDNPLLLRAAGSTEVYALTLRSE